MAIDLSEYRFDMVYELGVSVLFHLHHYSVVGKTSVDFITYSNSRGSD